MDVRLPDGTVIQNVPDNTSKADLVAKLKGNGMAVPSEWLQEEGSKPFGQQLSEGLADIPRQVGLTARHGLKAIGNTVGLISDPIGGAINAATGSRMKTAGALAGDVADSIGLPKPANATERIVGDVSELMASGGGFAGASGRLANAASGAGRTVLQSLSANPLQQVVSAGAAGGAGGYTRETGGNDAAQLVASLAAGVGAPMLMNRAQQAATAGRNLVDRLTVTPQNANQRIDIQINRALQPRGMTLDQLPANVRNSIRSDVSQALRTDGELSPDALRRLADYRLTGATPTAATLTLDPAMVSQQKNLAKLGINSKDAAAQQLGRVENSNNRQLIEGLNSVGANTATSQRAAGEQLIGALSSRNDRAQSLINRRYEAARATTGRSAALDPSAFTQQANNLLDDALLGGKLPSDVRNMMNWIAAGEKPAGMHSTIPMPFNVDIAEQLKTRIGELQRSTTDMAERKALGLVRQSLDNTPLLDGQGQPAIDAFNRARRLNRAWMGVVEKTPALQAVRDGIEPDKFVQQFIVGNGGKANVADLAALRRSVQSNPEAMAAVKGQIAAHLKKAALNGSADEVGNFSQSAYNKALKAIGDEKLSMFFTPEQVSQIKAIGRVASYEQFQPRGSAVNNSNTAGSALASILDRVGSSPLLRKVPFGNMLADPIENISVGIGAQNALNVPRGLLAAPAARQRQAGLLMSPAALIGVDDR